jgi:hypothetical protein
LWNIERRERRKCCFVGIGEVAVGAAFGQVFNGNLSYER